MIRAEIKNPVPDTAQLVPRVIRAELTKRASRRNQMEYPAVIQFWPKFFEFR